MIGVLLGTMIATTAAKKIGEAIVENAVPLAATAAVATAGVVAGGMISSKKSKSQDTAIGYEAQHNIVRSQEEERRLRLEAEQERLHAIQEERRLRAEEEFKQQRAKQREIINKEINESLAKFAICYYIALSDGVLSDYEKNSLNQICLDIYALYKYDHVKSELLKIYNTPNMNFIKLEKYLHNVDSNSIASFLSLADEIAMLDGTATDAEKESIYKIRKYLTDKTGKDYLGNYLHLETNVNLTCHGCTSPLKVVPYSNKAVCPYCGFYRYLQPVRK
ncbi:MAG: hypothetical protein J6Z43_10435 [Clostridiales bacterium]|nr:hypothetical protein [Clostridiales bacterium]